MSKRFNMSTDSKTTKKRKVDKSSKLSTTRSIAEKALLLASKANKSIERKTIDFTGSATVTSTASALHFTAIAQGTTQSQRIGNSVFCTGMAINYYWTSHPTPAQTMARLVIYYDTQTLSDDTAHTWTEVMDNASILAMVNRGSLRNRFKILHDKVVALSPATNYAETHKVYIPFNKTVEYNGIANTEIQKNGIYGLLLSTEPTNGAGFVYYARVYYNDA